MTLFCCALVVAALLLAHGNTLTFDYIWEDHNTFIDDSPVKEWRSIPLFFVRSVNEGFSVSHVTPYYRPVTATSWGIDWLLFRGNPSGSHLINLLIHGGASILIFLITRRLTEGWLPPLAASLLCAVHPAGMESVAYVAARADILCTLFTAGAILAALRFRESGSGCDALLSLVCTTLALLSKEPAVLIPLLLLADAARGEGTPLRRRLLLPGAAAVAVAGYLVIRTLVLVRTSWDQTPFPDRLWTGVHVVGRYLITLLAPLDIRTFYDIPTFFSPLQQGVWEMGIVILLWLGIGVLFLVKGMGKEGTLLLLVPLSLLPVSNIPAMILPSPMAGRYLHLPLALFSVALATLLPHLPTVRVGGKHLPSGVIFLCLIPVGGVITLSSNGRWKENERFFAAMIAEAPRSPLAWKLAANYHGKRGEGGEMARYYTVAYSLTRARQIGTAREMIRLGYPDRARRELLKLPNPLGDREVVEILSTLPGG